MEKGKKALVLSGGSIKGAFQAGVISEVLGYGYEPDFIYGVSVGALNGAFLSERAGRYNVQGKKTDWKTIGKELEEFWLNNIKSFENLGYTQGARTLLKALFRNFDGLVQMNPLYDLVKSIIKEENLRNSPVSFTATSVNLADGKVVNADLGYPHIIDYILASTAIPIMMPVVNVGGAPLVDGGVRDVAPLKLAYKEPLVEEIYCILCQPEETSGAQFDIKNLLQYTDRLMEIVSNEILTNDIKWAEFANDFCSLDGSPILEGPLRGYRKVPLTVFRPKTTINVDIQSFDSTDIKNMIDLGKYVARENLKKSS